VDFENAEITAATLLDDLLSCKRGGDLSFTRSQFAIFVLEQPLTYEATPNRNRILQCDWQSKTTTARRITVDSQLVIDSGVQQRGRGTGKYKSRDLCGRPAASYVSTGYVLT